jgi:ELWxxDGT repeat protein
MFQCSTWLRRKTSNWGGRLSVVRIASRRAAACPSRFRGARRPEIESLETLQLLSGSVVGTAPLVYLSSASAPPPTSTAPPSAALVQDLVAGKNGSFPQDFVGANGTLFFLAFDQINAFDKLWASDGTGPGTHEVVTNLEANPPVALGASGSVAFTAFDLNAHTFGIWATDGTTAGTHRIAALPRSGTDAVGVLGTTAFFEIFNFQNNHEELWKSDGTPSGTGFVATIPYTTGFTASGGKLFFDANDGTHGDELWATDGTAAGTGMVADINPGANGSYPFQLIDGGGTLDFLARSSTGAAYQLWTSDGTAAGTKLVAPGLAPDQLAARGRGVIFTGVDASGSPGLWSSDGTTAGTHEIASLPAGSASGLVVAGGTIFFGFYPDDSVSGDIELWTSDGTAAGTAPIATLTDASELTAVGSRVYFTVDDPGLGNELFTSDGTAAGTAIVNDINPGPGGSFPGNLTAVGGALYFDANDRSHGDELWKAVAPVSAPAPPPPPSDPTPINEGTVFAGIGSFTDSDADGPWTATVNYGDGSGDQPLVLNPDKTFALQHLYPDSGSHAITVTVTGNGGATGSGTETLSVLNVAPTVSLAAPASSPEGTPITPSGVVGDPSPADVAAGFAESWSVTKDGAPYAASSGSAFSFTPDDNATYVVTLVATDKDGLLSSTSTTIGVTNVAPAVQWSGDSSGVRGQARHVAVTVTDPSAADTAAGFTATIDWGDGTSANSIAPNQPAGAGHVFTQAGTYTVTVTAADKDGGVTTATWSINVAAAALEPDPNNPTLTDLVVGGTTGPDTIVFLRGSAPGSVQAIVNGSVLGTFQPTGRIIAFGQAGNDQIGVCSAITLPSELHGGAGNDLLVGGGGDNILVGDAGDDILLGSGKHNVLIGGLGSDLLIGEGDDLMVAGATAYDADSLALGAILAEWERPLSLASRIADLTGGIGANGQTIALGAATILNDLAVDILLGLGSDAWSLVNRKDLISDACKNFVITTLG